MAREYKVKDLSSLSLKDGEMKQVEVEGIEGGKVLLLKTGGKNHALSATCTHYGGPLAKGVLSPLGRITCPWHGACFNVSTGDVEDAPALDPLAKFEVLEKDGAVYIKGEEATIKGGRTGKYKCSAAGNEKIVVVGGGSGTVGVLHALREHGSTANVTVISTEGNLPIDRPKLSKALITDVNKILLRPQDWYDSASISVVTDEVNKVDFDGKTVSTASGKSYPYTKLVLATGGTPRRLPLDGFNLENVFVLRSIKDTREIVDAVGEKGKKIVVIGSSFIGMEVGNALAKDNEVTIVGMENRPLERVMGEKIGEIFQKKLEESGVKFKMGASIAKATPSASSSSKVGAVHLKDGTELPADLVILGVGVAPATTYLKDTSVKLEKDGSLRTDGSFAVEGLKDVYAIGDIASFPYSGPGGNNSIARIEHWDVAQNAGRSVGTILAGAKQPKPFIPVFWSALGAQLRYCGNTVNGWDGLVIKGEPNEYKFAAYYAKGETIVAMASMGMDPAMAKTVDLMLRGEMPTKSELEGGKDPLSL